MPLTEQQLLSLLIITPALITAIIVYFLTLTNRNKVIKGLSHEQRSQQQQLDELTQQVHHQETDIAVKDQHINQLRSQLVDIKTQFTDLHKRNENLVQLLHISKTEINSLQIEQQKERQFTDEKLKQLEHNKQMLKEDFEVLAQKILKSAQHEFSSQSKDGLDLFLKPFRQQISDFKDKVENIHTHDLKQREELKTELKNLQLLNQQISDEAQQLTTALKGQKKTQGNWGELILENVLDRSGLQLNKDYKREVSFSTNEGRKRPDAIVYLPQHKHLVIDAKVSLNAYTRFINSETDLERSQAIKEHVLAISNRIKELSSKNYFDLPGLKSPEMVFMFIPIESAFVEAIKADESLFQLAIEQQVLVTTPTTLLTSLNIVKQLWRFEDQNKHTAELADQAAKVYNQLRLFLESMESLGIQLDKSRATYDTAMKQFISGKGNLVKRVESFQKLGVSVKKELPQQLLAKADLELDLIDHLQDQAD